MNLSAASSSCAVVTPGRHLDLSIRRHRAWTAPASAMREICSWVFLTIISTDCVGRPSRATTRHLELFLHLQGGEHRAYPVVHLVGSRRAVDAPQDSLAL